MILFHGTTAEIAKRSLNEGLLPRKMHGGKSHYAASSHPDAVYLTDAYAPYFAMNTGKNFNGAAVLVIDTTGCNIANLVADEDALEQATRRIEGPDYPRMDWDMMKRTNWFKMRQFEFAAKGYDWRWSLKALGTCAYHGPIPKQAIKKIISWTDLEIAAQLMMIFDPTISIINYHVVGKRYRYLLRALCDLPQTEELSDFDLFGMDMEAVKRIFSDSRIIRS